jgi:hypothetical protein
MFNKTEKFFWIWEFLPVEGEKMPDPVEIFTKPKHSSRAGLGLAQREVMCV